MIPDTAKPADSYLSREAWVKTVKPLYQRRGDAGLDTLPIRPAVTVRDREVAREQVRLVTRSSFAMPDGYDRINWSKANE